jgi:isochorismate hydrolase
VLDASAVQFLVTDLQQGIIEHSATNHEPAIRRSARILSELSALFGIPVTRSSPVPGQAAFIPEIPDGELFIRNGPSAWDDDQIRAALTGAGRPVLAVCGVLTEIVVLHTALGALAGGFDVHVVTDACGGASERTEQAAFSRLTAAGARLTSVASLATELVTDFTTPPGQQVLGLIFS